MIRVVLFAIAILAAFDFARAEVNKAEAKSCNWGFEVFKAKIGETCQKDLLSNLKSEQDKIFAQRIFKNWQPLTGYEVELNDTGLIRIVNPKEDDFLEIQWISIEPAIAIINGIVVTDEVKDESMYRRFERMLKKSDEAKVAMGLPARRLPLNLLLASDEAQAQNGASTDDAAFVFMIDMNTDPKKGPSYKTGTAEELIGDDKVDMHDSHHISRTGHNPLSRWWNKQHVQCRATNDGNGRMTIVSVQEKIGDKSVTIESVAGSRTKFMVKGYPNPGENVLVDFGKGQGALDPYQVKGKLLSKGRTWVDKHGKKHRTKPRYGKPTYAQPCTGLYRADLNDSCGKLWQDLAEDPNFPEVKAALEKYSDLDQIRWGKDISCEKIYPKDREPGNWYRGRTQSEMVHECQQHFGGKFPKENRFFAEDRGKAHFSYCSTSSVASCSDKDDNGKKKLRDADLEGEGPVDPDKLRQIEIGGMKKYVEAWNQDANTTHMKDDSSICPSLGLSEDEQAKRSNLATDCLKPPKNAGKVLKDYYKGLSAGNVELYGKVRGGQIRRDLEQKVLSAMMLGECCNSQSCADKLESKAGIKLDGGKTSQ